jgi:iron complex transport system permease protein
MGRILIGEDNRHLIPASAVIGALFMLVIDTLARNLGAMEIPLSILTGLIGAPLFFWLLVRQKAKIS